MVTILMCVLLALLGACAAPTAVTGAQGATADGGPASDREPVASVSGTLRRRVAPTPTAVPTPSAGPAFTTAPVDWAECDDDSELEAFVGSDRFECAAIPVPLDHADPEGATIDIAVIRLPAPAAADRIGSLIVNPGGPGGSGVDWVRFGAIDSIPAELRARFDIVGFDPRGVGASTPVQCGEVSPLPDVPGLDPDSSSDREAIAAQAQRFADACAAESGDVLPFVSTEDAARDLDLIREAVGDDKLTYLGYSYGTYLGTVYAEMFGGNVRALVLDGAIDPSLDLIGRATGSAVALERALDTFVEECADNRRCSLHERFRDGFTMDAFLDRLAEQPVPAGYLGANRRLNDGDARLAMMALLRDRNQGWPLIEEGVAMAEEGDGSLLLSIADGVIGRGDVDVDDLAANLAVNCTDLPQPDTAALFASAEELRGAAPRFGPSYLMIFASCAFWPAPSDREPTPADVTGAPPLLVVGTTGDAVTPFAWSEALAAQLDARLLTRNGSQHTAFGGENVCTDRAVVPYLIDLVLPPEGWACG